jgi:Integrase core domain
VGDAHDNALMESIIGLFKTEAIATTVFHDGPYKALADVEYVAAGWVDWYNHRRLHGSLGWLTPVEYEQDHYGALSREPQPAWGRQRTRDASPCATAADSNIGMGRTHAGTCVILLVQDLQTRVINAATGELLRDPTLEPSRDYQPTGAPKGPSCKTPK